MIIRFFPHLQGHRRELRVISLNAWMIPGRSADIEERFGKIVRMVHDYRPDILLLQEIWTDEMKAWARGLLAPWFPVCVAPREDPGLLRGRYGSGLLVLTKLPVLDEDFHFFSGEARTFAESVLRRGFQMVTLDWNGHPLLVLNTHLSSYEKYESYRLEQIDIIHRTLANHQDDPVLIGGDFNMLPGSRAYKKMIGLGWRDLPGGNQYTWIESNPYYDESEPNSRLDYFFGRNLTPRRYRVLQTIYSDHLAIYLQIRRERVRPWRRLVSAFISPNNNFET